MTRRQKAPLRPLMEQERQILEQLSRARQEPAIHVIRAQLVLAVADGCSYVAAADSVGRRSGDAVSELVNRFNKEGLAALEPRHDGGHRVEYDLSKREVILATVSQPPDRAKDGAVVWSLSLLQRHLREQPEFAKVSTYTIWRVLHEADWSWQANRSWCHTGHVLRRRKSGVVEVTDPDTEAKKS
jgi:transposase